MSFDLKLTSLGVKMGSSDEPISQGAKVGFRNVQ